MEGSLTQKDIDELQSWLLSNLPRAVSKIDVRLDGWYDAESTVPPFNIPRETWLQIPEEEAIDFVVHVTPHNRLVQPRVAASVASPSPLSRPPMGPETRQQDSSTPEKSS